MISIPEISVIDAAFPAHALDWMPAYEDIPEVFRTRSLSNKWKQLQRDWFYHGLKSYTFVPKPGVDVDKALRVIQAIQGSYAPKHEHKEAAVAYLLSEWFEDAEWTSNK